MNHQCSPGPHKVQYMHALPNSDRCCSEVPLWGAPPHMKDRAYQPVNVTNNCSETERSPPALMKWEFQWQLFWECNCSYTPWRTSGNRQWTGNLNSFFKSSDLHSSKISGFALRWTLNLHSWQIFFWFRYSKFVYVSFLTRPSSGQWHGFVVSLVCFEWVLVTFVVEYKYWFHHCICCLCLFFLGAPWLRNISLIIAIFAVDI